MGSLYMGLLMIELFGIFSAWKACPWPQRFANLGILTILVCLANCILRQDILLPKSFGYLACYDSRDDASRDPLQVQGNSLCPYPYI